jgi:hypothetical protein
MRNCRSRTTVLALALCLPGTLPTASWAQSSLSAGRTYSLTPEQKADILANGSESRVDESLLQARSGGDGKIHGEMGVTVGTNNTRGLYGNAVIPLGKGATAAIAFDHYRTDLGKHRWRRGRWLDQGYDLP